jgi:hypothetical protein
MGTILRFNQEIETDPLDDVQLSGLALYYGTYNGGFNAGVSVVPFCLDMSKPSGTTNFSRIQDFQLVPTTTLFRGNYLYSVKYNVLKFANGQASLLYD